jgi:hypothetical protein
MLVYEDNFGFWDIGGPEEQAFFDHVQRHSVLIACQRCDGKSGSFRPRPSALLVSQRSNMARRFR